jgi:hypothetical protein
MKPHLEDFVQSASYDSTLRLQPGQMTAIGKKYLQPVRFDRTLLFNSMMAGRTIIFNDYPVKFQIPTGLSKRDYLLRILRTRLPADDKIMIRTGKSHTPRWVTIREALERWERNKSRFGVTDLHFRDTKFYRLVDADAVSHFNLLPSGPEEISTLEMLTLVISSTGIFSDSHSDDGDGSNHCFVGKKLWLAWDRKEGRKVGLQDCTFDTVYRQAKFSIKKFLQIPSSHWFIVSEDHTLFMPGNFAHKVVTLEPYIGFGSFYVSLPNYVNSIKRWLLFPAGDVNNDFLSALNSHLSKLMSQKRAKKQDSLVTIGLPYLKIAASHWKKGLSSGQVRRLENSPQFVEFLALASGLKATSSSRNNHPLAKPE